MPASTLNPDVCMLSQGYSTVMSDMLQSFLFNLIILHIHAGEPTANVPVSVVSIITTFISSIVHLWLIIPYLFIKLTLHTTPNSKGSV